MKNIEYKIKDLQSRSSVEHTVKLMTSAGFKRCLTFEAWSNAIASCEQAPEERDRLLVDATNGLRSNMMVVPRGLDELPTAWLQGLPELWQQLCAMHPKWRYAAIQAIGVEDGILRLASSQEDMDADLSEYDKMRILLNLLLSPSSFFPL
jgi:hypothetical protein